MMYTFVYLSDGPENTALGLSVKTYMQLHGVQPRPKCYRLILASGSRNCVLGGHYPGRLAHATHKTYTVLCYLSSEHSGGVPLFTTLCGIGSSQVTCGLWVSSSHGVSTITKLNCTVSIAKFMRRAKFCSVPVKNACKVVTRDRALE